MMILVDKFINIGSGKFETKGKQKIRNNQKEKTIIMRKNK